MIEKSRRKELISVLQREYLHKTTRNLPVYGVSTRSLRDFLTSERDQLRRITKIPSDEFRMWELDLDGEERRQVQETKQQETSGA